MNEGICILATVLLAIFVYVIFREIRDATKK